MSDPNFTPITAQRDSGAPTTMLIKYETACRALAEARSVDEAKAIRDKSEAIRIYARQAKNKQLEIDAAEIRIRAERRLGEMLAEQKATVGLNRGLSGSRVSGSEKEPVKDTRPTLADAGIDKKLSSRAQALAAVPEEEFEDHIGEWRDRVAFENERVTVNLEKSGRQHQEQAEKKRPSRTEKLESELEQAREVIRAQEEVIKELTDQLQSDVDLTADQKQLQIKLNGLRERIRVLESQRDDLMQQVAQLQREVKALRRRLGDA